MSLQVHQFSARSDNFGLLLYDKESGEAISIDSPEQAAIETALTQKGLHLTHILNTHHHYDHVDANLSLKEKYGCQIIGAKSDAKRIPGIDLGVSEGDVIPFAGQEILVFETPGHTVGHLSYWVKDSAVMFVGDTLFSMGCGRLFEGNGQMMWESLQKLMKLPPETMIYCAHEYTISNGEFALEIEPDNQKLQERMAQVRELRRDRRPTLPVSLALELETNPFLRPDSAEIQKNLSMEGADLGEIFTKIRKLKDSF